MSKVEKAIVTQVGDVVSVNGHIQPPVGEVSAAMEVYTQERIAAINPADFISSHAVGVSPRSSLQEYYPHLGDDLLQYVGPTVTVSDRSKLPARVQTEGDVTTKPHTNGYHPKESLVPTEPMGVSARGVVSSRRRVGI